MVCRQCGSDSMNNDGICIFCGTEADNADNEIAASDGQNYETNLGFARASSGYEAPFVMELKSIGGIRNTSKIKNGISDSRTNNGALVSMNDGPSRVSQASAKTLHRTSKNKEKKLAKQRQRRLQEELGTRLQEGIQGSLNKYIYQGLNQDIREEKEETRKGRYKDISFVLSMLGIFIGVFFTVFLIFYIEKVSKQTDFIFMARDSIVVNTSQSEAATYVFNSKGDMLFKINGFLEIYYTPDHTAALVYNRNTRYFAYVNAYHMKEFTTTAYSFALSEDGNYILYSITGGGSKYYLMLYDVRQNKETMVDRKDNYFDMLNVLPGGDVLSYCTYSISNEDAIKDLRSYIIRNKVEPELVGKDLIIYAISTDLSSIYYGVFSEGRTESLYVRHDGIDKQLSEDISGTIFFNRDSTEVLVEDNGSYYFCSKDGERRKVIDQQVNHMLLPKMAVNMSVNGVVKYAVESLVGKLFLCNDNSIQYLDENLQMRTVAITSDVERVTLSKDGRKLFYLDSQKRLINMMDPQEKRSTVVMAYGVSEYLVSGNMSQVYYIRDDDLYCKKNNREERLICEKIRSFCSNPEGTVFFLKDYESGKGTLYYSEDGQPAEAVEGGTNVTGVMEWNFGVVYQKFVNNTPAVFYNTKDTDFLFIMDGYDLLDLAVLLIDNAGN